MRKALSLALAGLAAVVAIGTADATASQQPPVTASWCSWCR